MKKYVKVILFLVCLFGCISGRITVFAASGSDVTAPKVTMATFKTASTDKPGTINLELAVEETETGIQSVSVGLYCYKNGNTNPLLIFGGKEYTGDTGSVYSGNITIEVPVSQGDAAGQYLVGYIEIKDNAGNTRKYFDHYNTAGYCADATGYYLPCYGETGATNACRIAASASSATVKSNGDDTAPFVTDAEFVAVSVNKPGKIQLKLNIIEDTGIQDVDVIYCGKKGKQPIQIGIDPLEFNVSGNTVIVDMPVNEDHTSGDYYVESIKIKDTAGNERKYLYKYDTGAYYQDDNGSYLVDVGNASCKCYIKNGATVNVVSTGDMVAPIVKMVTLQTHTVKKPGILPIDIELAQSDELKSITVILRKFGATEQQILNYTKQYDKKEEHSKVTLKMPIATATESDKYYVERIVLRDYSGNERTYFNYAIESGYAVSGGNAYIPDQYDETVKAYFSQNSAIVIEDEFDVNFEVALSNKNLLDKIKSMPEGETGKIYIDGNGTAGKELFEEIKGKDKTLVFYKDNYQWVFNGKDVTMTKDIKLKITFEMVDGSDYDVSGKLLKIKFEDNGQLPGKANVRVKSDYTYELYEMTEAMYLYYLNPKEDQLEYEDSSDVTYLLDGSDHWCKFDITHNSTYMVSGKKIENVKVKSLKITGISKKLAAGKKMQLSVTVKPTNASKKSVKWTTSNKKYATVTSKGVVKAKKAGIGKKVTITATAKDGSKKKAKYTITIMRHAVKSIKLKAAKSVKAGKSVTVKATVKTTGNNANKKLKWTSSNTKYATVNSKGKVTAKKAGKGKTVKITAKATDGSNKKATVTIKIK